MHLQLFFKMLKSFCRLLCNDNCMNKCNSSATRSAPFSATSDAPSHSYFQFLIGQILYAFSPLCQFLRAFSSAFHTRFHLQPKSHLLGELFVTLLCSSKQIVACTLKNIYTNACIIYSAGIALCACIK